MSRSPLAHVDFSVRELQRSLAFWKPLLEALGFERLPTSAGRANWRRGDFELELRPSEGAEADRQHDRYAPGLHHLAFHAPSREEVDHLHELMAAAGATVLDPPADYGDRQGYEPGYYAVFFEDPDGMKVEVVFLPSASD